MLLRITAISLVLIMVICPLHFEKSALAACSVNYRDASYITQAPSAGNCGNTAWELVLSVPDSDDSPYDEGEYDGTGTCVGGYKNCSCGNVASGYLTPTKTLHTASTDNFDGTYDFTWYWNIVNYEGPSYSTCTTGPCAGTGESQTNTPFTDYNIGYDSLTYQCVY